MIQSVIVWVTSPSSLVDGDQRSGTTYFLHIKGLPYCAVAGYIAPQRRRPSVAYLKILFGGGVQQIELRTEDRENEDLGAVAPLSGVLEAGCNLVQEISFHTVKFS